MNDKDAVFVLSKENYLSELNDVREKLSDFLGQVDQGKLSYIKEVSLKLRILFCDKSGTRALLKTIEEKYGFIISVLVKFSLTDKVKRGLLPGSFVNGLQMYQVNSAVGWFGDRGNELVSIFDAINKKDEILIEGVLYSYKEIFEAVADKMGGAHVDGSISHKILRPHSNEVVLGGLSMADRAIFDTARSCVVLIDLINKYIQKPFDNPFIKSVDSVKAVSTKKDS